MKKLILIAFLVVSNAYADKQTTSANTNQSPVQSTPEIQELKVNVKGMVCAFCAQGIEKKFKNQPEVSGVEVSLENKYVKIKFKDGKNLSKEKIIQILKDSGFEASFGG